MQRACLPLYAAALLSSFAPVCFAAPVEEFAATINAIGTEGGGYAEAAQAVQALSQLDKNAIPEILRMFDDDKPVAANWLRSAVEAIADRARDQGEPVSQETLTNFLNDKGQSTKARAVAFSLLKREYAEEAERLVPTFRDDPSLELRLLAVERLIQQAHAQNDSGEKDEAVKTYRTALDAARNPNQVTQIAEALKKLGEEVDTSEQFGFVKQWYLIAPFDWDGGKGFDTAYPPEEAIDLQATYEGKQVEKRKGPAAWKEVSLPAGEKRVDFNKEFAELKEVVGYAATTFQSDKKQRVELRWSTPNATRVWVNGQRVASDRVYHAGDTFDQYSVEVPLQLGANTILVKVVQNDQTASWTNFWHFQLRVCDSLGTPIRSQQSKN